FLVTLEHLTDVPRHRIEVTQVCLGYLVPLDLAALHGGGDAAVAAAPADHQQVAFRGPVDGQLGDLVGDVGNLLGTSLDHVLVVLRVVADVAGDVFLLQATNAVLE